MDGWLCGEKQFLLFTYRSILVKNIKLMYHMFEVNVCYSLIIDQSIVFSPLDRFGSWYKTSTDPRWPPSEYPGWDTGQWHVATVCDILGCNVHTHTRNEWPKWLCGEYECALVSIVRPFTWYTLYHYYWYAASYGTIRVNQVVRKRYQCFVWRLVVLSPSAATMKTLAPVAWKTCCECWQPDSGHNSSPNVTSMYIDHLPVNICHQVEKLLANCLLTAT